MMRAIIQVTGLKKAFKDVVAVDDLSFEVREGELFAFLGVNGAGKSTTINILCGILQKDGGMVEVDGVNIEENPDCVKAKIGVVFQNGALDKELTVFDNLRFKAALYGLTGKAFDVRLKELCALLELDELLRRPLGKLSGGQKRRIDVARALLHRPKILVLDEPTTGLDPKTRQNVWACVEKLRKETGLTVFLTTHYMEEAAEADYVVILDKGKVAAQGTPVGLKNEYASDFIKVYGGGEALEKMIEKEVLNAERKEGVTVLEVDSVGTAKRLILAYPEAFSDFEVEKGKMDDVFLKVTGRALEGGNGDE
ncbi:MAG: ABC transporter ATP-binding protein [Clostridia bacterium]|nr:ABC transporter ATP-binding protein [Clostridia bacterium]